MTLKIRHDVNKIRHDATKIHHDIKNTSWRQTVRHDVKTRHYVKKLVMTSQHLSWRQKVRRYIKGMLWRQKLRHDVNNFQPYLKCHILFRLCFKNILPQINRYKHQHYNNLAD